MTTKRLILIRHAKAEAHGGDDAKRKLAPRGEVDAVAMGDWLEEAGVNSGVAVVSPAVRTVQTWDLAAAQLTRAPRAVRDKRLFNNTVADLLAIIKAAAPQTRTLLLVGHNPSIAALAMGLDDGTGEKKALKEIATKYPTSGIAVFTVERPWSALALGGASLVSFAVPRG